MSISLLVVVDYCEGVGGRVAFQPCSIFSLQYAIALAGVSKFATPTAGLLSPRFSIVQGRLSESSKKRSKLNSKGELGSFAKAEGKSLPRPAVASCCRRDWG